MVRELFKTYHGYKSVSSTATYCLAVFEDERPVVAFTWQPPPPGAAKSICPEAPYGVLSLSRMVAVPKKDRRLKHISKPLRRQMNHFIDRTRWPVLVTYSDEGQGHNGFVYSCSGWIATDRRVVPVFEDSTGARCSPYANGRYRGSKTGLVRVGDTTIQRWENWVCSRGEADAYIASCGWERTPIPGKKWRSGNQAYTYTRSVQ